MISDFYYENIVRSALLSKYNYTNVHEIISFKECVITISFSNENFEDDINIIYALTLLELVTSQKAYIKKVFSTYKSKVKTLVFTFQIVLKESNLFDFLNFFSVVVSPAFKLRYINHNLKIDTKSFTYNFAFKDTNVFPFLPEVFYKWESLLNFSFTVVFTEKSSIKEIEDFYNCFHLASDFITNKDVDIHYDVDIDDMDVYTVTDTEILSLCFFNTKKSMAIIEIERRNKIEEEQELIITQQN